MRLLLSLVLTTVFFSSINAQKGWEIGGWLGTSFYFGDLNNRLSVTQPGIAGGLNARWNFNTRISLKNSLNFGTVGASDVDSPNNFEKARNLSFKSNIYDFSSAIEFNFFNYVHGSTIDNFTPYLLAGANVFRFNPTAELEGAKYGLKDFGTEGQAVGSEYLGISAGAVVGAGYKWDITYDLSLNIEYSYRILFTDYLDDVSGTYPSQSELSVIRGVIAASLSDRSVIDLGQEGNQRGNSKDNDSYIFLGISIMKYFGRIECPKISDF